MTNRKTPRKPAYVANPQLIKRACDAVEQGLTITQAAQSINVSTATLYRWIATDPQIKEQIDAAKERMYRSALTDLLKSGHGPYTPELLMQEFLEFIAKKKAHQAGTQAT